MSEWQPIDTAPKDGSLILTWGPHHVGVARWLDYAREPYLPDPSYRWAGWIDNYDGEDIPEPTHWLPLPAPPTMMEMDKP